MNIAELLKITKISGDAKISLVLPKFCYSEDFLKEIKDNKLIKNLKDSNINDLFWQLDANGIFYLKDYSVNHILYNKKINNNIIVFFDVHDEIYRKSNDDLVKMSKLLGFSKEEIHDFLMNFNTAYKTENGRNNGYHGYR